MSKLADDLALIGLASTLDKLRKKIAELESRLEKLEEQN